MTESISKTELFERQIYNLMPEEKISDKEIRAIYSDIKDADLQTWHLNTLDLMFKECEEGKSYRSFRNVREDQYKKGIPKDKNFFHLINILTKKAVLLAQKQVDIDFNNQKESKIYTLEDLQTGTTETDWLLDKIIPLRGLTVMGGAPATFKSFLSLYLCFKLIQRENALDKEIYLCPNIKEELKPLKVLYLDEENSKTVMSKRIQQLTKGGVIKDESKTQFFYMSNEGFKLNNNKHIAKILSLQQENEFDLIVFDSLVRFLEGNENDVENVRKLFDNVKVMMRQYPNLAFIFIHHTRKEQNGGSNKNSLRGSGDFVAMADTVNILEEANKDPNTYYFKQVKNRHACKIDNIAFKVKDLDNGGLDIECLGEKAAPISAFQLCLRDSLKWIKELNSFFAKQFHSYLKSKAHSRSISYEVLAHLKNNNVIKSDKNGHYIRIIEKDFVTLTTREESILSPEVQNFQEDNLDYSEEL